MDAQLERRYRTESGRLTAARGAYGALLFVSGVGLAGVLEYRYHPERLLPLLLFFSLELTVCAAASVLTRSRRFRGAGVALTFAASAALIACVTAYALFAGTNVTVMAFLFVVFELTTALVFPWGARPQALLTAAAVALYAILIALGATSFVDSVAYAFYAVAAGGLVSVLGASFLDRQRFTLFMQREQLDQHLLTFRELTRAFRGFDPQRAIFLACRAAMQTFGLRWLWVAWQTADGCGAQGYLVRQAAHEPDWEPLDDAQPVWSWMAEWELDARAFVMRSDDTHLPITMRRPQPASLLCVPLQFQGERLGAICGTRNGEALMLDSRGLALASILANAASIALANARLYQQAAAASEEKSVFLARIAHELRNPLQALLWDLDSVRAHPETRRAELDRVEQNALMTLDLAKELQDYAEVETKRLAANPEPVNLTQTLDNLQATAMGLLAGKQIEYRTTVGAGAELVVTDPFRLRQIVGNLISNAVKFTTRGSIAVDARSHGDEIAISVTDTGPGIPESERADIFNPFFRGTARASIGARGMGLGLAIARDLAQLLGGRIEVESAVGKGSSFRLVLPRPSATATADGVPDMSGRVILLVEDDAEWRQTLAAALRHADADVIETSSGLAGVRLAREHQPATIVLDLCLPELGGIDVIERLKADPSLAHVPVVVVTAERDARIEARCRASGCAAFVTKPCDVLELVRVLSAFPRAPRTGRESIVGELAC